MNLFRSGTKKSSLSRTEVVHDALSGLDCFPEPGLNADVSPEILPVLHDPEEEEARKSAASKDVVAKDGQEHASSGQKEVTTKNLLWMPDKICKVCYNCEDPFTMYRRRHHCRMCGQVFCDRCSSEYVDGSQIPGLGAGLHRACQLCHDLHTIQTEKEGTKPVNRKYFTECGIDGEVKARTYSKSR
mgnify:CR=1 FL=1|jgi:1-phosphatidylinositol-3-phosphate 5-kinase